MNGQVEDISQAFSRADGAQQKSLTKDLDGLNSDTHLDRNRQDLLFETQQIYNANYRTIQLLIVASVWYLAMTSVAPCALQAARAALS